MKKPKYYFRVFSDTNHAEDLCIKENLYCNHITEFIRGEDDFVTDKQDCCILGNGKIEGLHIEGCIGKKFDGIKDIIYLVDITSYNACMRDAPKIKPEQCKEMLKSGKYTKLPGSVYLDINMYCFYSIFEEQIKSKKDKNGQYNIYDLGQEDVLQEFLKSYKDHNNGKDFYGVILDAEKVDSLINEWLQKQEKDNDTKGYFEQVKYIGDIERVRSDTNKTNNCETISFIKRDKYAFQKEKRFIIEAKDTGAKIIQLKGLKDAVVHKATYIDLIKNI